MQPKAGLKTKQAFLAILIILLLPIALGSSNENYIWQNGQKYPKTGSQLSFK